MSSIMNYVCPICHKNLFKSERQYFVGEDLECVVYSDHYFAGRISDEKFSLIKIRLNDGAHKLFMRVNFDDNISYFWTKQGDLNPIKINCAVQPDFSDLSKLKQKIKTYLLFS